MEHDRADRLPHHPRSRRRCRRSDVDDDRRRHLHGRRTSQGPGIHRLGVGDLLCRRPRAGRHLRSARRLAMDLLGQHPAVPARRIHAASALSRREADPAASHRLCRRRAAHDRSDRPHPRHARGWQRLGVGVGAQRRLLRPRSTRARAVRRRRAPRGRADRRSATRCAPAHPHHDDRVARHRRPHDRCDELRAGLPRGVDRDRPASLRLGGRRAHARLAARRRERRASVHAHRIPTHRAHRHDDHRHRGSGSVSDGAPPRRSSPRRHPSAGENAVPSPA
jgi:hypothetical protein